TFGEGMAYDHADAGGFIRLFGLPERVRALTRERLRAKAGPPPRGGRPRGRRPLRDAGGDQALSVTAPRGFRAAAVASGIKAEGLDLALVVADRPSAAAGVFPRHRAPAAPVLVSRELLAAGQSRAVVINAGCANAATGEGGLRD